MPGGLADAAVSRAGHACQEGAGQLILARQVRPFPTDPGDICEARVALSRSALRYSAPRDSLIGYTRAHRVVPVASDIPPWAGSVDESALTALLGMGGEQNWLDYKRQCEFTTVRGVVEMAKDAGAMMIVGGYVLVGADDNGRPSGDVDHLKLFDTATVHDKLAKYLPKRSEIRVAVHQHQGQSFALIYVAPHPDGFCLFEQDDAYPDGKEQKVVFRRGDVFARHGTKSERWSQDDIAMIKQRLQGDADRGRDQRAEAIELLGALPTELGEGGIWLGLAVAPEYQPAEPAIISREGKFLSPQGV
jgi:hypothetical protein